jgi:hypothetical protein
MSSALDRVLGLAATGRIDSSGLRELRDEIERARRAGTSGQHWARLAAGDLTLQRERLDLTHLLREALAQRGRELQARSTEVRQRFEQAEVISDSTLLFSLLQAVLDWSMQHAQSRIDLRLDIKSWPSHARLSCAYLYVAPDDASPPQGAGQEAEEARLNTVSWHVLLRTAQLLGLGVQRSDSAGGTQLLIEFPDTVAPRTVASHGLQGLEADDSGLHVQHGQPLAGRRVLIWAPRAEIRSMVREALRPMGLLLEMVATLDEAFQACAASVPDALVYEQDTASDEFELLRQGLLRVSPHLAVIGIADDGSAFEVVNVGGRQLASVGRAGILESLPGVLLFEMSRQP